MKPEHVGVSTDNLVLGKHSGRAALKDRAKKLGFDLGDNQLQSIFIAFKKLADEKKEVFDADIEALVMGEAVRTQGPWTLDSLYVSAGSDANRSPQAKVTLSHEDGTVKSATCDAAGPVNAAFLAISEITDCPLHLDSFSVQSVSEGKDAMAEASVRVSTKIESYQGHGASTDTVLAGAKAYLDVINRIERRARRQKSIAAQH
jgi:2-isopropylmalate synthase